MRRLLPLLALSLGIAACDPPAPPAPSKSSSPPPSAKPPASEAPDAPKLPAPTAAELGAFARSNNAFAIDLYARARAAKGNLVISPVSITTALTMTWAGARGDTAAQMKKVLHAEGTAEEAVDVAGKVVASYRDPAGKATLRIANRLFGEQTFTFERAYVDRLRGAFGVSLDVLDFEHDVERGRKRINDWVQGETRNRIKELVPPGGIDADTRLVLANAIHFLGRWSDPFEEARTRPEAFHPTPGESKDVPTMHHEAFFRFGAVDGVKVLDLPYESHATMTLVLPDAADGLDAVEKRLTPAVLDGWVRAARVHREQTVIVSLPRFEIDPPASVSLGDILQELGMPIAFDREHADFTGIANPPKPDERLHLSKVFHKAFIKLDEKGTEAAAATAEDMASAGAAPGREPPEFKADHPFLFFLRDARSGTILFMGRVVDPAVK